MNSLLLAMNCNASSSYIVRDGQLQYLPIPATTEAELALLNNRTIIDPLLEHDYWFNYYQRRFGFDQLDGRGFPYLWETIKVVAARLRSQGRQPNYRDFFLDNDANAETIMRLLFYRFKVLSEKKPFKPLVLLHCQVDDLIHGKDYLRNFLAYLETIGLAVIDVCETFQKSNLEIEAAKYYESSNHYSIEGNRLVAEALQDYFEEQQR